MKDRRAYFAAHYAARKSDPAYVQERRDRFRKWWARLTPEERREHRIRQKIATAVTEEARERGVPKSDVLSAWGMQ